MNQSGLPSFTIFPLILRWFFSTEWTGFYRVFASFWSRSFLPSFTEFFFPYINQVRSKNCGSKFLKQTRNEINSMLQSILETILAKKLAKLGKKNSVKRCDLVKRKNVYLSFQLDISITYSVQRKPQRNPVKLGKTDNRWSCLDHHGFLSKPGKTR